MLIEFLTPHKPSTMATETILYQNDIVANSNDFTATTKKSQESDCHRQKQKKKNKASDEESDDVKENDD